MVLVKEAISVSGVEEHDAEKYLISMHLLCSAGFVHTQIPRKE